MPSYSISLDEELNRFAVKKAEDKGMTVQDFIRSLVREMKEGEE